MLPPNQNMAWEQADYDSLGRLWDAGASIEQMSTALGRSPHSVVSQLTIRGYVYFSSKTQAFHLARPLWTVKDLQRATARLWTRELGSNDNDENS